MANVGVSPFNPNTPVGKVRSLIGDTDPQPGTPPVAGQGEYMWYSDAEITGLLSLYGDNPWKVAARILRSVATSHALMLKKWSSADLSVDGPAIAAELRAAADDLLEESATADAESDGASGFTIVDTGGRSVLADPMRADITYAERLHRADASLWPL